VLATLRDSSGQAAMRALTAPADNDIIGLLIMPPDIGCIGMAAVMAVAPVMRWVDSCTNSCSDFCSCAWSALAEASNAPATANGADDFGTWCDLNMVVLLLLFSSSNRKCKNHSAWLL